MHMAVVEPVVRDGRLENLVRFPAGEESRLAEGGKGKPPPYPIDARIISRGGGGV